jgi:predicted transposase YdaD
VSYDNACKYLAEHYPANFVRWLLGVEVQQIEVLKTEVTLELIRADSVTFLQATKQILHIILFPKTDCRVRSLENF